MSAFQSARCAVLCHAEERSHPFAALDDKQATKQDVLKFTLTQRRQGARTQSSVNKEKATNENNELLGKTEFYSWKFVCIRGSNCHLMPELNFSQSPLSSQRFCSYQLSSSPLLFMFSFLPLLMSASPQTSPTSLCQRELYFSQSPLSSRRFVVDPQSWTLFKGL